MSSFPTQVGKYMSKYQVDKWREEWRHLQRWAVDFESATDYDDMDRERTAVWSDANAVSSEIVGWPLHQGHHAVLIDIDQHCDLVATGTSGHFHLYIDVSLPWWRYRILLRVLAWCGIIEKGFYKASKRRKGTFLRTPDKPKKPKPELKRVS